MEHYQITKACKLCGRVIIADIFSVGVGYQTIEAMTCLECAKGIPQTAGCWRDVEQPDLIHKRCNQEASDMLAGERIKKVDKELYE